MTKLQLQQIKLNQIVEKDFGRVAVILEGRDTAGKTGTIRELTHYLPTSKYSVSFSNMPSAWDMENWLESWEMKLPGDNQIVLFDRSWYSRAMVQKLNGWCSDEQYEDFMASVLDWEAKQPVKFIKLWLSISEEEQRVRIGNRQESPLTSWKFSPNDALALSKYDQMTPKPPSAKSTGIPPSSPCIVYHGAVARVKKKLLRVLKKLYEVYGHPRKICGVFGGNLRQNPLRSRPAPRNCRCNFIMHRVK